MNDEKALEALCEKIALYVGTNRAHKYFNTQAGKYDFGWEDKVPYGDKPEWGSFNPNFWHYTGATQAFFLSHADITFVITIGMSYFDIASTLEDEDSETDAFRSNKIDQILDSIHVKVNLEVIEPYIPYFEYPNSRRALDEGNMLTSEERDGIALIITDTIAQNNNEYDTPYQDDTMDAMLNDALEKAFMSCFGAIVGCLGTILENG